MPPFFLLLLLWMAGQPVSIPPKPDPFKPPFCLPALVEQNEWWKKSRKRNR